MGHTVDDPWDVGPIVFTSPFFGASYQTHVSTYNGFSHPRLRLVPQGRFAVRFGDPVVPLARIWKSGLLASHF